MAIKTIAAAAGEIVVATSAVAQPTNSQTAGYALDISSQAASPGVAIANNNNISIGAASSFSGLVVVNDTVTTGSQALFLCGGGFCTLIGTNVSAEYSVTLGTASKLNLAYSGAQLVLENKTGVTRTVNVLAFRIRAHN